jgi:uncharacterized integral membrane protein (TIGR00697 family)
MNSIAINTYIFFGAIIVNSIALIAAAKLSKYALAAFIVVQTIMVNLLITKQIVLFGLSTTPTDALAISITLSYNLMQELYGKQAARQALSAALACVIFYLVTIYLHLLYIPAPADTMQVHFAAIFSSQARIIAASLFTYYVVQYGDIILYGFFKKLFANRFFIARNYLSVMISHLIDTVLFTFLGLYGLVHCVWHIILISYSIKLCTMLIQTPFISFAVKKL